jgi:hypothetical protein
MSFKEWMEKLKEIHPWRAGKKEILSFWQALPPNTPIPSARPVFDGSSYRYNGVRLTGDPQFINSILSRIKDLLPYEGDESKLHLLYAQQTDRKSRYSLSNSFVFYSQIRDKDEDK